MKKIFVLIAFLIGTNWAFNTNAIAEEKGGEVGNPFKGSVEKYSLVLNSDPRFDKLKKAAAGDQSIASEEMRNFVSEYCNKTHKCVSWNNSDLEFKSEIAVKFAKIHLKAVEQANIKYAESLVKLNNLLKECQEKSTELFSQEFKESCSEEFVCKGKKAKELSDMFEKFGDFDNYRVGAVGVQLSKEEKIIDGQDISFMLNKPQVNNLFPDSVNAVYPKFSVAPTTGGSRQTRDRSKMFSKPDMAVTKSIYFDNNDIPEGIMTLRALKCVSEKSVEDNTDKKDKLDCQIFVGNTSVYRNIPGLKTKERKSCLVPEKTGFFASLKDLFTKKEDLVEVNDSGRGMVKAVETETSGVQPKANKSSER